jgi:hypothetical protein
MRPRDVLAAALISLLSIPSALNAQNAILPFLGGGLAKGVGELGSDTGSGWTVVGGFDVSLDEVTPGFGVGLAGTFAQIPYSGPFDESTQVTAVSLEAIYAFGDATGTVRPFVRGGGGLHVRRYDPGDILDNPNTVVRPGLSAAAGVMVPAGSVDFMVGARVTSAPDGGFVAIIGGISVPF